ncbi:MAG TPA: hypothetical protein VFW87_22550, partial [Pirellulales bacterium]|nr:hypothetical protein [Pirellulales bacterium]
CVRTYRYELRTTGPARAQRIDFQLTLHTAAAKPIAFIPVSLDVRPLISAMPSSVYVKVNSSNEFPIDRVINVRDDRSGNGRELQLQKPADDFLKVTVERLSDGGQFSMRLRLRIDGPPNDPAQNRGVRKTALTLCTDMPENERLVIPVVVEYR